ncbi:hypothetical protein DER46DRAFT_650196 [Fusarium sp. MPI-SDFR-AT-0072]|nr:hypothetical protein DER46DRAFT_650196 [Fusarium sp. MPI-SDFR-AT-0072]
MDSILRRPNGGYTQEDQQKTTPSAEEPTEAHYGDETCMEKAEKEHGDLTVEFKDVISSITNREDLKNLKAIDEQGQSVELRYRVSSAHLKLVSPVFKAMPSGPFVESFPNQDGRFEIRTSECNAEALLILLDIIHGRHRTVQKTMDLDLLREMAILVDYYKCDEIMEMFAENLIASAIKEDEIEGSDFETNTSRLDICWVFSQDNVFNSVVRTILKSTEGPIQTDLPLPATILTSLGRRRQI